MKYDQKTCGLTLVGLLIRKGVLKRPNYAGRDTGFSVAELSVIITVMTLLLPVVVFTLGGLRDDLITSLAVTTNDTDTRSALSTIVTDLRSATGFRASLGVGTTTPLGINGSGSAVGSQNWSYCGVASASTTCDGVMTNAYNRRRVLIAYTNATDAARDSSTAMPVFVNDGTSFNFSSSTPVTNAYIYFAAPDPNTPTQNNLYRRTLTNINVLTNTRATTGLYSSTGTAGTIYQKQSCFPTAAASYPSLCQATDTVLARNIESFWVDYYDNSNQKIANVYTNNATTAATVVSDIINSAKSIQVTITKKPSGSQVKRSITSSKVKIANRLAVIAPITAIQVTSFPGYATSFAMSPDGSKAYIVTQSSDTVTVLNTSTNAQIAQISVDANSPTYSAPDPIAITPDGSRLYVGNVRAGTVSVINTSTNTLAATVTVGTDPYNLVMTPDGSKVYVSNTTSRTVSVINTSTNTLAATIAVGALSPYQLVATPDGSKIYVATGNTVTVINTSTNTIATTISTGFYAPRLTITPDGSKVYTGGTNAVAINTSTNTVAATISLGVGTNVQALGVTPDSTKAYIVNYGTNSVNVINTTTNAVVATIAVGTNPLALAIPPNGGRVYVGNDVTSNVSIIDTSTNTLTTTITVGTNPRSLASTRDSSKVYIGSNPMYAITNP